MRHRIIFAVICLLAILMNALPACASFTHVVLDSSFFGGNVKYSDNASVTKNMDGSFTVNIINTTMNHWEVQVSAPPQNANKGILLPPGNYHLRAKVRLNSSLAGVVDREVVTFGDYSSLKWGSPPLNLNPGEEKTVELLFMVPESYRDRELQFSFHFGKFPSNSNLTISDISLYGEQHMEVFRAQAPPESKLQSQVVHEGDPPNSSFTKLTLWAVGATLSQTSPSNSAVATISVEDWRFVASDRTTGAVTEIISSKYEQADSGRIMGLQGTRVPWDTPSHVAIPLPDTTLIGDVLNIDLSNHRNEYYHWWNPIRLQIAPNTDYYIQSRFRLKGDAAIQFGSDWWVGDENFNCDYDYANPTKKCTEGSDPHTAEAWHSDWFSGEGLFELTVPYSLPPSCGFATGTTILAGERGTLCNPGELRYLVGEGPWYWVCVNGRNRINDYNVLTIRDCSATLPSFSVVFVSNGGSTVETQSVVYKGTATEPLPPNRSHYGFLGWYTDSALTSPFTFTTPITHDVTLYAKWEAYYLVKVNDNVYYHLQEAYNDLATINGSTIKSRAHEFYENLQLNKPARIIMEGGYNSDFLRSPSLFTFIRGNVSVRGGTMVADRLIIR